MTEPRALAQLVARHVDEQPPRLVLADGAARLGRWVGPHPSAGTARGEPEQPFADVGGHVRLDVIHHPAGRLRRLRQDLVNLIPRLEVARVLLLVHIPITKNSERFGPEPHIQTQLNVGDVVS